MPELSRHWHIFMHNFESQQRLFVLNTSEVTSLKADKTVAKYRNFLTARNVTDAPNTQLHRHRKINNKQSLRPDNNKATIEIYKSLSYTDNIVYILHITMARITAIS